MIDRKISATQTFAYAHWALGLSLIVTSFYGPIQLAALGLLAAGVGGVAQIRGMICGLEERERNAFDLGRDYESSQGVRRVH